MEDNSDYIKTIVLPEKQKPTKGPPKPKRNRQITHDKKWISNIEQKDLDLKGQLFLLEHLYEDTQKMYLIKQLIRQKVDGYHSQDIKKGLYDEHWFVDMEYVIDKLRKCSLCCFYCQEEVYLLYELAHDQKQWTLERIDNTMGHNKNNVEIACLSCNIRRRTMYHEKYRFTKQVKWEKTA